MAGHWEWRYSFDEKTGRKTSYRVWVEDKVANPAKRRAQRRARRQARQVGEAAATAARAARRVAERARQQKRQTRKLILERQAMIQERQADINAIREARRAAFNRIQGEASRRARQSKLVQDRPAPVQSFGDQTPQMQSRARELARRRALELARSGKAYPPGRETVDIQAIRTAWQANLVRRRAVDARIDRGLEADATAKDVESALAEAEARAKRGEVDGETVAKLAEKYMALAEKTASEYKALVDEINEALDKGKVDRARALYQGKDFRQAMAEYARLFGTGKDARQDGAFNDFWKRYNAIEKAQAEWWKRQMRYSLDSARHTVQEELVAARAAGDADRVKELEALSKIYEGSTSTVIDHWEVKTDAEGNVIGKQAVYRKRTIQEELEAREALRRIQMVELRRKFELEQWRARRGAQVEGWVKGPGGTYMAPDQANVASRMMRMIGGGDAPAINTQEQLQSWVDQVVRDWERENPRPVRGGPRADLGKLQAWDRARQQFEASVYRFYGSETPGALERFIQLPGVSHGLAILQGGVSAIGGLARVGAASLPGGDSKVGGSNADFSKLPPAAEAAMDAAEQEMWDAVRDRYAQSPGSAGRFDPRQGIHAAREKALAEWLTTAEGRAWQAQSSGEAKAKSAEELRKFYEGFYGEGDIGSKLQALNEFGSEPFQSGGQNLLFQLLADPTNAIPLKFTTYLARARFAAEGGSASKFLGSSKFGAARDFVKVDEGTLRLRSELQKVLRAGGGEADQARRLTDELLADVVNLTERSDFDKAIRAKLVKAGINPRLVDDSQLFSLIEDAVKGRLKREGIDYSSQADEIQKRLDVEEAARRAKAEARVKAQGEGRRRAQERAAERLRAAEAKRVRLTEMKDEAAARQQTTEATRARAVEAAQPKTVVRKLAPLEVKTQKRTQVRTPRGQAEYYKRDPLGNLLPVDSRIMGTPEFQATVRAARGGDLAAQSTLTRIARVRRNRFRQAAEDRPSRSPYRPTQVDFFEAAGVGELDDATKAGIVADREAVRAAIRKVGRGQDDAAREIVSGRRGGITAGHNPDESTASDVLNIGEDLIAARDLSPNKLKGIYEVFSGLPGRAGRYRGGLYDKVRSARWLKAAGAGRVTKIIRELDDEALGYGGAAAFRDGGQALFELFHRLRLSGQTAKLRRISAGVDELLASEFGDESVFGWMWKVMEERAGLVWAMDAQTVEAAFLQAAETFGLHPHLALSQIPNGYYAHAQAARFRVSKPLLGYADEPTFRAAPADWVETDALNAVNRLFAKDVAGDATRVLDYTATRYGSFARANKIRHRIHGEMVRRTVADVGSLPVADAIIKHLDEAELQRLAGSAAGLGRSARETLAAVVSRRETWDNTGKVKGLEISESIESAASAAYWAGDLPHLSVEGHKLMLLARLQDLPDGWLAPSEVVGDYLIAAGRVTEARGFFRELFAKRVENLWPRAAGELVEGAELSREWQFWKRVGLMPELERVNAWLRGRTVRFDEEVAGEQAARDAVTAHERDATGNPYDGTMDVAAVRDRLYGLLNLARDDAAKFGERAAEELARTARLMSEGLTSVTYDELREVISELRRGQFGETIDGLLEQVRDQIGADMMGRWLAAMGDFPEMRAVRKDVLSSKISNARIKVNMEYGPAATQEISRAEGVFNEISKMTEEQWWKHLAEVQNRILTNPTASAGAKRVARRILRDIESARWAKSTLSANGAYVRAADRAAHRRTVVALYGRDAEELIRPNAVAPYVEDAQGVAVERTRQYWRRLRSTPDVDSAGIRELGPGYENVDHFPVELFDEVDQEIARALEEVRGVKADYLTGKRRKGAASAEAIIYRDKDPLVQETKRKVLEARGISVAAYDEARGVLRWGMVQSRSADFLMRRARAIAERSGGDYRSIYLKLREKAAREDARSHLGWLAGEEMYGLDPDVIFEEFVARWADDGQLRRAVPPMTPLQKRTLEEAVKSLSGVDDLADTARVGAWLRSRNAPPLDSRAATRDFLVQIGAWSPRRAEQFVLGERSWSVAEEGEYWLTNYGAVPAWADEGRLATDFEAIFHDQDIYYQQMRDWGVFNRDAEIKLRLSGKTAAEIEEAVLKGDPTLGVNARRELEIQRRYVIDRYGSLVADADGNLTALPWLMYPDELRQYFATRGTAGLAESLIQNVDELAEVQKLIDEGIEEFWQKYIAPAAEEGAVAFDDVFKMASEIQARLLAHPKWARRYRDLVGDALGAWASFNRALVFTQLSFAVANVVDSPIKSAWYRYTRRGLVNRGLAGVPEAVVKRAQALTPADLGLDVQTSLYRLKQRPVKDYLLDPVQKGAAGAFERLSAPFRAAYRIPPSIAAKAELTTKMNLARSMYPTVYADALKQLKDPDLADAFTRKFVKEEISRMWPTVGDGPLEKLFNEFVPFASYMVRNKVLFISEALAHPSVLNWIEYVGRFIEDENRKRWAEEHPGEPLPDHLARRIELPWAPGYFLDLGQFADATRGLQPIFKATEPQKAIDIASQFIRLVNPGTQAGIYMLTNALGITQRVQWQPIVDEKGFITGYRQVITGWTEPWSKDQPTLGSVFWVVDAMEEAQKLGAGGWTNGELSQLLGKILAFGAISTFDRGASLFEYYKSLREKDLEFAKRWLAESENGQFLQQWLLAKATSLRDIADQFSLVARWDADPKRWFHTQDAEFQRRVGEGYGLIEKIRQEFADRMLHMDPGSNEYREQKALMYLAISEVYQTHPELMTFEVYSKSPAEWSQELVRWQTDKLMDQFFALDGQRPQADQFKTREAYRKAYEAWEHQKEIFLATYPQVRDALGSARTEYQRVQRQVEAEWDAILDRIAERGDAIAAAKAAGNAERADLLYLAQELDFSLLERDRVAMQFTDEDLVRLSDREFRPRKGALATAQSIFDFDRRRLEKARREGREQEFLDEQFYAQSMREVILKAKGGDPFGKFDPATFVAEMRKRPRLAKLYFARNPGKEQEWARSEQYVKLIGPWGKAARAGDWDRAERIWNSLPQWVKDRYYANNPGRRKQAAETAAYMGWVQRWVKHFDKGAAGDGMRFFWAMPKWVRDRYFENNPEKRVEFEAELRFGNQLAEYFASDGPEARAAYLEAHPELKRWLASRISSKELRRQAIMAAYRNIPSDQAWLRRVFREKYPEIFSQEAAGKRRLRAVYDKLARHPSMLPAFEKWVEAIFASYQEMLRFPKGRLPYLEADHEPVTRGGSRSAADVSDS